MVRFEQWGELGSNKSEDTTVRHEDQINSDIDVEYGGPTRDEKSNKFKKVEGSGVSLFINVEFKVTSAGSRELNRESHRSGGWSIGTGDNSHLGLIYTYRGIDTGRRMHRRSRRPVKSTTDRFPVDFCTPPDREE